MAVEFLHELNVPFFKVGSGDTNNFPYLEKTAKKGECLIFVIQSESRLFVFYTIGNNPLKESPEDRFSNQHLLPLFHVLS